MGGTEGGEGSGLCASDGGGLSGAEIGRGVQADSRVAVVVVIAGGEGLAVCPGGLDGSVIPVSRSSSATVIVIKGKISIPALGSLILRGRVPHLRLAQGFDSSWPVAPVCGTGGLPCGSPARST